MSITIAAKFSYWRNHDVSKIPIRPHFPRIDMGWRPLAHVCLWLHVSSCLHATRWRYIFSINMASIKRCSIAYQFQVFRSVYFLIDIIKCNRNFNGFCNFSRSFFYEINLLQDDTVPLTNSQSNLNTFGHKGKYGQ